MGFSTPATRSDDFPLVEPIRRSLPEPVTMPEFAPKRIPMTTVWPVRTPEYVPVKRSVGR